MNRTLVAYFSATGVTKQAAERLAKATGADLFEIRPAVPYSRADLNWMDQKSRSTLEMNDAACRPEIADAPLDLSSYDTVFVGFPIWWYTAPRIVETFLERYDFSGKTMVPFATSGGSGMGKTVAALKSCCPNAKWVDGRVLNRVSDGELAAWAKQI